MKGFRFDGNMWNGFVGSPAQASALIAAYPDNYREAKECPGDVENPFGPNFGFRIEHQGGTRTLGEWLDAEGIDLPAYAKGA